MEKTYKDCIIFSGGIMKRSDGVLVKSLDPFIKIIPYIMEKRSDSQNYSKQVFVADPIDRYILEKREQGYKLGYMHIFIAAYVRLIAERPQLNRFIMNWIIAGDGRPRPSTSSDVTTSSGAYPAAAALS